MRGEPSRPGEFELIARYFRPLAAKYPGALDLGDDAALIDVRAGGRLVASADALIAGVDVLAGDPPSDRTAGEREAAHFVVGRAQRARRRTTGARFG